MKARDIMTANPAVVTPDEPIARAAEIMRQLDVGIVPVVHDLSDRRLAGVLTDRDIAIRCVALHHDTSCRVRDHMSADDLGTVDADADVDEVIAQMERHRVRRIPVVSEGKRLAGIIAQADLAVKLGPREPLRVEQVVEHISEPASAAR